MKIYILQEERKFTRR